MSDPFEFSTIPPLRIDPHPYRYTETSHSSSTPAAPTAAATGSFICTLSFNEGGQPIITIGKGSYQYPLGTNTDITVPVIGTAGHKYAYACIKHGGTGSFATGNDKFKLETSNVVKNPTNMDAASKFVEWSNILLAEVVDVPGASPPQKKIIQRRVGNLAFYHRVVNGNICLWAETTAGTSL